MAETFQYVQTGDELCEKQRLSEAERAFQRAIKAYERERDADGVAYALGRMGFCYEQCGELDKAVETYQRAVQLETDIPAIYSALIPLLVDRNELDKAFQIADQWAAVGQRYISDPAHQIFVNIGSRLTREKRHEEAIALLLRAVEVISVDRFPGEHWAARGQLGFAYEKAGEIDAAMEVFATAIKEGSDDRRTYTRYIMYLERTKQYELALQIIRQGLKVQKDAAWEVDLRKRQQRIERKAGHTSEKPASHPIPYFSVRRGKNSVSLVHQAKFSPQIRNLAVSGEIAYVTTGGKSPKLSAWQIDTASRVWEIGLPEAAGNIAVTGTSVVTCAQEGRIGDGATILHFFDFTGTCGATQRLPDAPSEVAIGSECVYVGCRDGKLYAFSAQGEPLWSYMVPGSGAPQDSTYSRPSPYYVSAGAKLVAFSSFSNVFALNSQGKLLWRWSVPTRETTMRSGGVTLTMTTGATSVRGLAVTPDGNRVVVTADDRIYELAGGKAQGHVTRKGRMLTSTSVNVTGRVWAVSADEQVNILQDRRLLGRFGAPRSASLAFEAASSRLLAWSGKRLVVATLTGKVVADIEFAKAISHVHGIDDGRIVVGAGYLIILNVDSPSKAVTGTSTQTKDQPFTLSTSSERPTEEASIPIRWIKGEKLGTERGKARYVGGKGQSLTIEQLALEYYAQLGYQGTWSENEYWWAIMALLFWDVIFARLPGVFAPEFGAFPSRLQDMPHDFFTEDFYPRRKQLIEKRIADLTQPKLLGLRKPSIEAELRNAFRRHKGRPCRPIDWNRLHIVDDLLAAPRVLADQQLIRIMQRMLVDFAHNRRGLPDLFLYRNQEPLFCEVKSEKERVASHQIDWMLYLKNEVEIPVEICRVVHESEV